MATLAPLSVSAKVNCRPSCPRPPVMTTTLSRTLNKSFPISNSSVNRGKHALEQIAYLADRAAATRRLCPIQSVRYHVRMGIAHYDGETDRSEALEVINIIANETSLIERDSQVGDYGLQGHPFVLAALHAAYPQFLGASCYNGVVFRRNNQAFDPQPLQFSQAQAVTAKAPHSFMPILK